MDYVPGYCGEQQALIYDDYLYLRSGVCGEMIYHLDCTPFKREEFRPSPEEKKTLRVLRQGLLVILF